MFPTGFLRRRLEVVVARRENAAAAALIGARRGTLVAVRRSGGAGLSGPPTLTIVTVRPGSADEVLREQFDAALSAGYRRPRELPPGRGADGRLFPRTPGLPMLSVTVVREGERFRALKTVVPAGHTGVVVSLYAVLDRSLRPSG